MGIDAGTGSVRAAIFDLKGNNIAYATSEYNTYHPHNGWAEQKDEEWYKALKEAIPACIKKAGISAEEIVALTVDATTCTMVFLDEKGESVRTPIL